MIGDSSVDKAQTQAKAYRYSDRRHSGSQCFGRHHFDIQHSDKLHSDTEAASHSIPEADSPYNSDTLLRLAVGIETCIVVNVADEKLGGVENRAQSQRQSYPYPGQHHSALMICFAQPADGGYSSYRLGKLCECDQVTKLGQLYTLYSLIDLKNVLA